MSELQSDTGQDAKARTQTITKLKNQLAGLDAKNDQLYDHYSDSKISDDFYKRRSEQNSLEREKVVTSLTTFELTVKWSPTTVEIKKAIRIDGFL